MDLLLSLDPARNRFRFFRVELSVCLSGAVELHRQWGRVGTEGRAIEPYPTLAEADHSWC